VAGSAELSGLCALPGAKPRTANVMANNMEHKRRAKSYRIVILIS
jgi:hypothetical protein